MNCKVLKSFWLHIGLIVAMMAGSAAALAAQDIIDAENYSGIDHGRAQTLSGLIIRNLTLREGEISELILSRAEPFAPDAVVYIDGVVQGPLVSDRIYFQGTSLSDGHAQVSLSIGSDGSLRGVLADGRGHWRLLSQRGRIAATLVSDEAVPGSRDHDHFQCGLNSDIRRRSLEAQRLFDLEHPPVQRIERNTDQRYRVRVAYDTTARFMNLFNTDQAAFEYLGDLTNYISLVYVRELNTEIVLSSTTSRRTNEPWDTNGDLLDQFEAFWNDPANNVDPNRTLAHLVDAGPSQGVAYVGALCGDGFDYGVSQGLGTEFDPNADPQGWSFTVVAHELGHNFGSDHTHCYKDPEIDQCFNGEAADGCWGGDESLPTGGPAGQAPGTIMSYCHLLPGGLSNLSVTLGRNHGFGVNPERVPDTMRAHVLARAATGGPRCPQPVTTDLSFLVSTSVQGNGAVSPTSALVTQNQTTSFTVTPAAGNTVQSASGCNGTLQGNTFTTGAITAACTVSVTFSEEVIPSFLVSTQVEGNGTITPTSANVIQGETASFALTPAAGASVQSASGCNGRLQGNTYTTDAINAACTVSVVFSQVTSPDPLCAVVNQGIPDASAQGISSTVSVESGSTISKMEILLDIDHTWVGDLIIDLRHVPSNTTVRLVDRPGGGNNCSGNDIKVTLDDQAGPSIQTDCQDDPAAAFPEERYRPANPLSAYNGLSLAGEWTLTVSDNAQFDTGQLLRWCLIPTTSGAQIEIFADRFQQQQ